MTWQEAVGWLVVVLAFFGGAAFIGEWLDRMFQARMDATLWNKKVEK